jgi:TPP-dependent trihydroxycyclohexane-1,2-dione (THcHDO) dehydratase
MAAITVDDCLQAIERMFEFTNRPDQYHHTTASKNAFGI